MVHKTRSFPPGKLLRPKTRHLRALLILMSTFVLRLPNSLAGQPPEPLASSHELKWAASSDLAKLDLSALNYRNLGPFRAGSWITDIAVPEVRSGKHRRTFYVAARNGGVWKTTNLGTTFENITDDSDLAAIGDLAVAPSDPNILWVGTGDAEVARSSYSGDGVYLSTDAGESFTHVGLEDSHHIARIVVHPKRPLTAWVASMGHLFSPNRERGVFFTQDGGRNWTHQLDLGEEIGVIDLVGDPENPDVLYAAAYEKQRLPWHLEAGGPGSGIYRSQDGGATWTRLKVGLPAGKLGRIGIALCGSRPETLYAIIENLTARSFPDGETPDSPEAAVVGNELYRSDDRGASWRQVSPEGLQVGSKSAYAFNEVRVHPLDPERLWITSETLISSTDGGKSFQDLNWPPTKLFSEMFGDVRTLWVDPTDPEHLLLGSDGGVFPSWDGGRTTNHLHNLPLGEIYGVAVDNEVPYNIYAGLQDHEAWRGPIDGWSGSVTLEDWVIVGKWDGMVSQVDPTGRWYFGTTQFGNHVRTDMDNGTRTSIQPEPPPGEIIPGGRGGYRFTWTTPMVLSPHNSEVLYTGSHKVLRSDSRGDSWSEISPDLTTGSALRIAGHGHIRYCTITSLAESHLEEGLLWAGTDDGQVWVRDGDVWQRRTEALKRAGASEDRWVSRVVASRHDKKRAYISKSGYRRDDFRPMLYRTDDLGASWTDLGSGLPQSPVNVLIEDPVQPDLLFLGNDLGVYFSLDGGSSWQALRSNMPRAVVRDLVIQEREADLVVGTYGRGLWVTDIHPLRELRDVIEEGKPAHLFRVEDRPVQLTERPSWGDYHLYGDNRIELTNRPDGLSAYYWISDPPPGTTATLELRDASGTPVARLAGTAESGLHLALFETLLVRPDTKPSKDLEDGEITEGPVHLEPGRYSVHLEIASFRAVVEATLTEMPKMPVRH